MKDERSLLARVVENKWVCMVALIVGFVYMTAYGFLKNPLHYTASMIGLAYPRLFVYWGITSAVGLLFNCNYMYHKYGQKNKLGLACPYAGVACIMTTVLIPSTEIMSLQLVAHWGTALLFGVFFAAAIIIFLFVERKNFRGFTLTLIVFAAMLLLMIILLIVFNKNGAIESIPMWVAYIILFLINFTPAYKRVGDTAQA